MPQIFPDASDYLRFKKLQIIQDSNNSSNRKNKINKQREYDADSMIVNVPLFPFNYQRKAPVLCPMCVGRFIAVNFPYIYIVTDGKSVTYRYNTVGIALGTPTISVCSRFSFEKRYEKRIIGSFLDQDVFVNCSGKTVTLHISKKIGENPEPLLDIILPTGKFYRIANVDTTQYMYITIRVS